MIRGRRIYALRPWDGTTTDLLQDPAAQACLFPSGRILYFAYPVDRAYIMELEPDELEHLKRYLVHNIADAYRVGGEALLYDWGCIGYYISDCLQAESRRFVRYVPPPPPTFDNILRHPFEGHPNYRKYYEDVISRAENHASPWISKLQSAQNVPRYDEAPFRWGNDVHTGTWNDHGYSYADRMAHSLSSRSPPVKSGNYFARKLRNYETEGPKIPYRSFHSPNGNIAELPAHPAKTTTYPIRPGHQSRAQSASSSSASYRKNHIGLAKSNSSASEGQHGKSRVKGKLPAREPIVVPHDVKDEKKIKSYSAPIPYDAFGIEHTFFNRPIPIVSWNECPGANPSRPLKYDPNLHQFFKTEWTASLTPTAIGLLAWSHAHGEPHVLLYGFPNDPDNLLEIDESLMGFIERSTTFELERLLNHRFRINWDDELGWNFVNDIPATLSNDDQQAAGHQETSPYASNPEPQPPEDFLQLLKPAEIENFLAGRTEIKAKDDQGWQVFPTNYTIIHDCAAGSGSSPTKAAPIKRNEEAPRPKTSRGIRGTPDREGKQSVQEIKPTPPSKEPSHVHAPAKAEKSNRDTELDPNLYGPYVTYNENMYRSSAIESTARAPDAVSVTAQPHHRASNAVETKKQKSKAESKETRPTAATMPSPPNNETLSPHPPTKKTGHTKSNGSSKKKAQDGTQTCQEPVVVDEASRKKHRMRREQTRQLAAEEKERAWHELLAQYKNVRENIREKYRNPSEENIQGLSRDDYPVPTRRPTGERSMAGERRISQSPHHSKGSNSKRSKTIPLIYKRFRNCTPPCSGCGSPPTTVRAGHRHVRPKSLSPTHAKNISSEGPNIGPSPVKSRKHSPALFERDAHSTTAGRGYRHAHHNYYSPTHSAERVTRHLRASRPLSSVEDGWAFVPREHPRASCSPVPIDPDWVWIENFFD